MVAPSSSYLRKRLSAKTPISNWDYAGEPEIPTSNWDYAGEPEVPPRGSSSSHGRASNLLAPMPARNLVSDEPDSGETVSKTLGGIANWLGQPGVPQQGLLADPNSGFQGSYQAPNRLAVIGRLLSAFGKGYTASFSGPRNQQGFALANAFGNVNDELANIQSTDYQARRQEMLDRMEWDKAHAKEKDKKNKTNILPPGAILTDEAGNVISENPMAPKDPKEATGDALMVEKLSQGDPEKAREIWQQILQDKIRPPRDPVTNINMPKGQFIETDEGVLYANPYDGTTELVRKTPPKEKELRELSTKELDIISKGEDTIAGAAAAREGLKRAKELNELAAGGPLVPITKYIDYFTNTDRYTATEDLDNLISTNVLAVLKQTFSGGDITDREQQVLHDVQGSSNKSVAVRKEIFNRAEQVYNERVERESRRNEQIRARTYDQPQGNLYDGVPGAAPQAPITPPPVVGAPPMAGGAMPAPVAGAAPQAQVRRKWNPATGMVE